MFLIPLMVSDTLDIHHDQKNEWLYLDWKGPQELETLQAACQQVSAFIQQTGVRKALNDNSNVTYMTGEMASWVANVYLPYVGRAGISHVAWVYSPMLHNRSHTDLMVNISTQEPQIAIFDDVASAYTWLSSIHMVTKHYDQSAANDTKPTLLSS